MKKGIDVSHHQRNVDWGSVKRSGIDFAILRTGYAQTLDREFNDNVNGCKNVGMEIKGVYHFSYALCVDHAIDEAYFAVQAVEEAGLPKDTIIFYDIEGYSVDYAKKKGIHLGFTEINKFTKAFCDKIIELGYPAGVYFNMSWYRNYFDKKLLDEYEMWLADWTGKPDLDTPFHQYSDSGRVEGIDGPVDMNYFYGYGVIEEESEDKTISEIAIEVCDGKWSNGEERVSKLKAAGHNPTLIQDLVNRAYEIADEVIDGQHGNGEERKIKMAELGINYDLVQHIVNLYLE